MLCAVCNKESSNRRVCPYCFTPYPADAPASRATMQTGRVSGTGSTPAGGQPLTLGPLEPLRAWFVKQSMTVKASATGIVVVGALWAFSGGGETPTAAQPITTAASADAIAMSHDEAVALIRHTRETALVEEQADEVTVSYPAASFPVQEEGQVVLAQRFARADEVVNGRKRRIFFHAPSGRKFAQSDGVTGLTIVQ